MMQVQSWFVLAALAALSLHSASQEAASPSTENVIEMTAKKYEFSPSEIRVKRGSKVRLRVRALDRAHGIEFALYPEGSEEQGPPGLRFPAGPTKWRIEKDQEQVIEFIAERPGNYEFKCAVRCGLGHGRMKGRLIVEE
jgi:cytochrome c oxidase subunit 2